MHQVSVSPVPNYVVDGIDCNNELLLYGEAKKIHELLYCALNPDEPAFSIAIGLAFIFNNPANQCFTIASFFKICYFFGANHIDKNPKLIETYQAIPAEKDTKLFMTLFVLTAFFSLIKIDIVKAIVDSEAIKKYPYHQIKFPDENYISIIHLLGYLIDYLDQSRLTKRSREIKRAESYRSTCFSTRSQISTDFFDLVSLYNHYSRERKLQLFHHYLDVAMFIDPPIPRPLLPLASPPPAAPAGRVNHPDTGIGSINADNPATPLIVQRRRCRCLSGSCFCPGCIIS